MLLWVLFRFRSIHICQEIVVFYFCCCSCGGGCLVHTLAVCMLLHTIIKSHPISTFFPLLLSRLHKSSVHFYTTTALQPTINSCDSTYQDDPRPLQQGHPWWCSQLNSRSCVWDGRVSPVSEMKQRREKDRQIRLTGLSLLAWMLPRHCLAMLSRLRPHWSHGWVNNDTIKQCLYSL